MCSRRFTQRCFLLDTFLFWSWPAPTVVPPSWRAPTAYFYRRNCNSVGVGGVVTPVRWLCRGSITTSALALKTHAISHAGGWNEMNFFLLIILMFDSHENRSMWHNSWSVIDQPTLGGSGKKTDHGESVVWCVLRVCVCFRIRLFVCCAGCFVDCSFTFCVDVVWGSTCKFLSPSPDGGSRRSTSRRSSVLLCVSFHVKR